MAVEHIITEDDRTHLRMELWGHLEAGDVVYADACTEGIFAPGPDIIGSLDGCTWEGTANASNSSSVRTTVTIPDVYLLNGLQRITVIAHVTALRGYDESGEGQTFWDAKGADPYGARYKCYLDDGAIKVAINSQVVLVYEVETANQWMYGDRLQVAVSHNFAQDEHILYLNGYQVAKASVHLSPLANLTSWYFGMDAMAEVESALALYEHVLAHKIIPQRDLLMAFLKNQPLVDCSALYV